MNACISQIFLYLLPNERSGSFNTTFILILVSLVKLIFFLVQLIHLNFVNRLNLLNFFRQNLRLSFFNEFSDSVQFQLLIAQMLYLSTIFNLIQLAYPFFQFLILTQDLICLRSHFMFDSYDLINQNLLFVHANLYLCVNLILILFFVLSHFRTHLVFSSFEFFFE